MMCGKWRENLKIDGKGKNSNNTTTTQTNNIKEGEEGNEMGEKMERK
jgi:hypothetical protein